MNTTTQPRPLVAPPCNRCGGPTGVARGDRAAWIAGCSVCGNVQAIPSGDGTPSRSERAGAVSGSGVGGSGVQSSRPQPPASRRARRTPDVTREVPWWNR